MANFYTMNESGEVRAASVDAWDVWYQTADRHVDNDSIGNVHVSTAFLGVDHSFGNGPPLLFETMIFGGVYDRHQKLYSTKAEALEGHARTVALLREEGAKSR